MTGRGLVHRGDAGSEVAVDGDCVAKRHPTRGAWLRETRAYDELGKLRLEKSTELRVPRLLAACEILPEGDVAGAAEARERARFLLVLERLAGHVRASRDLERSNWRRMGRALGALHAASLGKRAASDTLGARKAVERRLAPLRDFFAANEGGAGSVAHREGMALCSVLDTKLVPALVDHGRRVFCHRDFRPHNVLWSPSSGNSDGSEAPGLVDFEHARWDFAAADFARLPMCWASQWSEGARCSRACAWDAFVAGYSERADSPTPVELHAFRGMHALATLRWGFKHRSHGRYSEGRGLVGDCLADYQRST